MEKLKGKTVAVLTENGFEEVELTSPKQALEEGRSDQTKQKRKVDFETIDLDYSDYREYQLRNYNCQPTQSGNIFR